MNALNKVLKIGTRGSPLAMWQAREVERRLRVAHPDLETRIIEIRTSGDWSPSDGEVRLSEVQGGKGQFAKEIEHALLAGDIDIAVHSMKDMDSHLPEGLVIEHMLPRADMRDAVLVREDLRQHIKTLKDLPQGAVVGTASVRRAAVLLAMRSDIKTVPLRGNVQTRIDKVRSGQTENGVVDATFLAMAGLTRLGLADEVDVVLSPDEMLPAAGQGAVGIEHRACDMDVKALLAPLNCRHTLLCVGIERAVLKVLDGTCHTPIGAYARFDGDKLLIDACIYSLDGREMYKICAEHDLAPDSAYDALEMGQSMGMDIGQRLKAKLPHGFLA